MYVWLSKNIYSDYAKNTFTRTVLYLIKFIRLAFAVCLCVYAHILIASTFLVYRNIFIIKFCATDLVDACQTTIYAYFEKGWREESLS